MISALLLVATATATVTVPRFDRPESPIALVGPARPQVYLEASGRKAAFLGREDGSFEAWVYPLKLAHGIDLAFEIPDYAAPIPGASLATSVDVRPEAPTIRYSHSSFTADATWLVPLDEAGGVVLLDVDTSAPLTVLVRFHPDLRFMWPAGLGGQYSYWDSELHAYVITESTRRHAAIVGSPLAVDPPEQPAHNLPDAPSEMRIPVTVVTARSGLVPIAIAASDEGLASARATYERLLGEPATLYRESADHYRSLREDKTRIDTPDDDLDLALEWGKVALDKGFVCNPKLGCGLVAGLGPSGSSERPGFDWYFGGDAFINSWAMTAYGDFETVRESLRFLSRRQRADGKMMHELSQSAAYIPWFEDYPYGYYHADTTPLYVLAVADYVEAAGDVDFAREIWPSIQKAYEYCASTDEDGDGLMDNTRAGLGAVETGSLRSDEVRTDVYLAAAWTLATRAAGELAGLVGDADFVGRADAAHEKARAALNQGFVSDEDGDDGGIAFAILKEGRPQPEVTVWPALGLWRGEFDLERAGARKALDALSSSGLGADWGARMLSRESARYDHRSYNNGAVWPFLTGLAALALYANDRPQAAFSYVEGTKELGLLGARGFLPELVSGDRMKPVDAAVPHQLFSTSGLVSPLLRGLVGFSNGKLAPRIPAGWDRLRVENLRYRGGLFDMDWKRDRSSARETRETLRLEPRGSGASLPALDVAIHLPPGAELLGRTKALRARPTPTGDSLLSWTPPPGGGPRTLEIRYRGGVFLEPVHEPLRTGDRSSRLRVLEERVEGRSYVVRLEGLRGRRYRVRLDTPSTIVRMENGSDRQRDGRAHDVEVVIPDGEGDWGQLTLKVDLAP
jgi:glycogen debranching enzyme